MELEELKTPINLSIDRETATFRFSDESHPWHEEPSFEAIIIAGIKKRIMWPPYDRSNRNTPRPLCKSSDNKVGVPQAPFPWDDNRAEASDKRERPTELDCKPCHFRQDPQNAKASGLPTCDSFYELVILDPTGDILILPTYSAAKRVVAKYGKWFEDNKRPTFVYYTRFELTSTKNYGQRYADLDLTKTTLTDRNKWVSDYLPLFKEWKATLEVRPAGPSSRARSDTEFETLDM